MNKICAFCFAAVLSGASNSFASECSLTIYEDGHFDGKAYELTKTDLDFQGSAKQDIMSSFKIGSCSWEICKHSQAEHEKSGSYCAIYSPGVNASDTQKITDKNGNPCPPFPNDAASRAVIVDKTGMQECRRTK